MGFSLPVAPLVAEHGLWCPQTSVLRLPGSRAPAQWLWCMGSAALPRVVFPDQGWNSHPLLWQGGDSLPLSRQESPQAYFRLVFHAPIWWERPGSQESSATVLALPSKALGPLVSACPSLSVWLFAHQVPLSMGFPRQDYWSGLPFPSPSLKIFYWTVSPFFLPHWKKLFYTRKVRSLDIFFYLTFPYFFFLLLGMTLAQKFNFYVIEFINIFFYGIWIWLIAEWKG